MAEESKTVDVERVRKAVQEILLAHGFDFTLQDAPGGGTEFVVRC